MEIPILDTPRLILRGHRIGDFEPFAAMFREPEVVRFVGEGKAFTRFEAWLRFLRSPGSWQLLGFGFWALEEKASGAFIGEAGYVDLNREAPLARRPEVGWFLAPSAMGKGYAAEAAQAALAWGRQVFGPKRMLCVIHPENVASIRVAQKCGFKECLRLDHPGRPRIVFDRVL